MVLKGLADPAPSDADITPYLNSAIAEWEDRTGWKPFLEGASADWRFDPPEYGRTLELRTGFTLISAVRTGITVSNATGSLLVVEQDYFLKPYDAASRFQPITEIEFLVSPGTYPKSIKVTGKKGYHTQIDDAAWEAVLSKAVINAVEGLTENAGDIDMIQQGPVKIQYAKSEEGGSILAKLQSKFDDAVARFMRVVI